MAPDRPPRRALTAYVVVAPGLEGLARDELAALGIGGRPRLGHGGIEVTLTTRQLYAVHRWARIPTRVLVRVAEASVHRFDDLTALVRTVDWGRYLPDGAPVSVHAASQGSQLYHEGAIVERVVGALERPVAADGARVQVRIDRDRATFSIDATGEPLHRRGWRAEQHAAPLRPTLAAAMLRAAGYDGSSPLVDPMAGSGTIAIEAACIALGLPIDRPFGFQSWPSFEPGTWASVTAPSTPASTPARIVAADRDEGAVGSIRAHIVAAGVVGAVDVEQAALGEQHWPSEPALVVCNPPYGRRLGDADALRDLYAALGRRVRDGGHRLCLLTATDRLARATGVPLEERFATTNGGIRVRCWVSPPAGR